MFNGGLLQNAVEVFAVGVGDEDLSAILGCKEVDDVLDALGVKFVEKVIEEENGSGGTCACVAQKVELCQFETDEIGFALSL